MIHNIYFLTQGLLGFALPRKGSYYILVEPGDTFGVVDITSTIKMMIREDYGKISD